MIDVHVGTFSRKYPYRVSLLDKAFQNQFKLRPELSRRLAGDPSGSPPPAIEDYAEKMEEWGVEKIVIHAVVGGFYLETCIEMNNILASLVKDYPDKIIGFATLPFNNPEEATQELDRAVKDLELKGLFIYNNYIQVPYESGKYEPVLKKASDLNIPVFIHTKTTPSYSGYAIDTTLDNPFRLFRSNIFKNVPKLKIMFGHLGGGIVFYKDLLISNPDFKRYFSQSWFDITPAYDWSEKTFKTVIDLVGEDRVMVGSNFPLYNVKKSVDHVKSLNLSEEVKEKILVENAKKILQIK